MFRVLITDKHGKQRAHELAAEEITLGRGHRCDLVLDDGTVSPLHARLVEKDKKHILVDLQSDNGVFVNRKRVRSPQVISDRDEIRIGSFVIRVSKNLATAAPPEKGRTACPRCGGKLSFRNLADYCANCNVAFD